MATRGSSAATRDHQFVTFPGNSLYTARNTFFVYMCVIMRSLPPAPYPLALSLHSFLLSPFPPSTPPAFLPPLIAIC